MATKFKKGDRVGYRYINDLVGYVVRDEKNGHVTVKWENENNECANDFSIAQIENIVLCIDANDILKKML